MLFLRAALLIEDWLNLAHLRHPSSLNIHLPLADDTRRRRFLLIISNDGVAATTALALSIYEVIRNDQLVFVDSADALLARL